MRVVVFFDLPVATAMDRKNYAHFRKCLVKNGFIMMQESVYSKLAINDRAVDSIHAKLRENRPPKGLIQALVVTERQFATMQCIVGGCTQSEELADMESLVIL